MDPELQALKAKLQKLQDDLDAVNALLSRHQHRGSDGSSRITGTIDYQSSSMSVGGGSTVTAGGYSPSQLSVPFRSDIDSAVEHGGALGSAATNYGLSSEQVDTAITGGLFGSSVLDPYAIDLGEAAGKGIDFSQAYLSHQASAGSDLSFWHGFRNPYVGTEAGGNQGSITQGNNTLTDSTKKWGTNELVGAHVNITVGSSFEQKKVASNTATTLTLKDETGADDDWAAPTGSYDYIVYFPIYNGSATYPWTRLYAGDSIRWGYGPTASLTPWTYAQSTNTVTIPTNVTFTGTVTGAGITSPLLPPGGSGTGSIGLVDNFWQTIYVAGIALMGGNLSTSSSGSDIGSSVTPFDDLWITDVYGPSATNNRISFASTSHLVTYTGIWPSGSLPLGDGTAAWTNVYCNAIRGSDANGNNQITLSNSSYVTVNNDFMPSSSGYDIGGTATANRWSNGYINKIHGLGANVNVLDLSNSGYIATNQVFKLSNSAGMPTVSQPGAIAYNSSTGKLVFRDGSAWRTVTST